MLLKHCPDMKELKNYLEENKQRYLDELMELLRIPSVSADPKFKNGF